MTGIISGVVRFQDIRRSLAALELEDAADAGAFAVIHIESGDVDLGDELVGNLLQTGEVDLFNRTRRDHVHAEVQLTRATREDAVAHMKD